MQQTALITGASSGLGAATAKIFSEKGYRVYGTSRKAITGDVKNNITWIKLDLSSTQSIENCTNYIKGQIKSPLTVIHNAGIGALGAALDYNTESFSTLLTTNLTGVVHFNHCIKDLISKKQVKLIFISSLAGTFGLNYRAPYVASKHALEGYVKSLRMELKPFGVYPSVVAPGDILTAIAESRWAEEPKASALWHKDYHNTVAKIDAEVKDGITAETVAKKILKVSSLEKTKFKYVVAKPLQRLSYILQCFLPHEIFEDLLINHYKNK